MTNAFLHNFLMRAVCFTSKMNTFMEGQVITKQCNNCENEFTLPGLVHSLHLSSCKTNFGPVPETTFYTINKTSADGYLAEERCSVASIQNYLA